MGRKHEVVVVRDLHGEVRLDRRGRLGVAVRDGCEVWMVFEVGDVEMPLML